MIRIIKFLTVVLCFCTLGNKALGQTVSFGNIGDNGALVTASLNDSTLTISGTGNMADFDVSLGGIPWNSYLTKIKTVVIDSGVTNIGNIAFQGCTNLQSITIPEGVDTIGRRSFYNCSYLPYILIPSSVTKIEDSAFVNCTGLQVFTNLATVPQNINSNVFHGITVGSVYLAVREMSDSIYQSASVWSNFKFAPPYVLIEGNLGSDIDEAILGPNGTILYLKYQTNNSNLLERLIISDGVSANKIAMFDYDSNGSLTTAYIDGTVFSVDGIVGNSCNISSVSSNGDYSFVENILWDVHSASVTLLKKTAKKYALDKAKELVDRIVMNSVGLHVENTAPSWVGLTKTIVDVLGVDDLMPPSVKVIYAGTMWALSAPSAIASCGSMILLATTPITLPLALPSIALCAYNAYEWYKSTQYFGKALLALGKNNGNMACSVRASLNGGTLLIDGNGALCNEILDEYRPTFNNGYTDRRPEIKKLIIGGGVTEIPASAFKNYTNLQNIRIENGSDILNFGYSIWAGSEAFNGSSGSLYLDRNISGLMPFKDNTLITSVTIGNQVSTIPAN